MRLIDADAMKSWIDCGHLRSPMEVCLSELDVVRMIDKQPTIDAEPVRHGRWEDNKGAIRRSECKNTPLYDYHGRMVLATRCHVCGAMMRKEVRK